MNTIALTRNLAVILMAAAALGLVEAWLGLRRRLAPHGVRIDG